MPMPIGLVGVAGIAGLRNYIACLQSYVKDIDRRYQTRSVAMIQLCKLFLDISPGELDQIYALRRF